MPATESVSQVVPDQAPVFCFEEKGVFVKKLADMLQLHLKMHIFARQFAAAGTQWCWMYLRQHGGQSVDQYQLEVCVIN